MSKATTSWKFNVAVLAIQAFLAVSACVLVGVVSRALWEVFMIGYTLFYTVE